MFKNVIGPNGITRNVTRILVTHDLKYLSQCDKIIVLKCGKIRFQGSYAEFSNTKGACDNLFTENKTRVESDSNSNENEDVLYEANPMNIYCRRRDKARIERESRKSMSITEYGDQQQSFEDDSKEGNNDLSCDPAALDTPCASECLGLDDACDVNVCSNIIVKEEVEIGQVSLRTYLHYLKSFGTLSTFLVILSTILSEGSSMGSDYWLNIWSDGRLGDPRDDRYRNIYLIGYGLFGLAMAILTGSSAIYFAIASLKASSNMHYKMLSRILKSPILFFDSTPLGRIMNRFATDISLCDNTLPDSIYELLSLCLDFAGTIVMILAIMPIFAAVIFPVSIIFFFIGWIYIRSARQLRRLVSISRSPIYSHFAESLAGYCTIRAFKTEERFVEECQKRIDLNHKCSYPSVMANRWLEFVCQTIGSFISLAIALFAVTWGGNIQPGEVGLIITNAMMINYALPNLITSVTSVETNAVAVERIKEYSNLAQEDVPHSTYVSEPFSNWPDNGEISFVQYSARYRKGLELVLSEISCTIKGGEKVCIIGRTGAGKSSIAMAIFRLIESASGKINIDNKDISKIDLARLRNSITIIPQDPVLITGTIRMNLDPEARHTDADIWKALKSSHLDGFIDSFELGIGHQITQGGENLSVGQRQLLCLARAVLEKNKILILDEATASVDIETDNMIQETLREEFRKSTVITIAHRMDTILDYDRVIVMDKGKIVEFGTIDDLMQNENGFLHSILQNKAEERKIIPFDKSKLEDVYL